MKILAVDDERTALNILVRAIRAALPGVEPQAFVSVSEALAALADDDNLPDVAFLDIEMSGMTGLELARILKTRAPKANIIFVTGFSRYALEAMLMRPSGYLLKPVDKEQILTELNNLRHPPPRKTPAKRVRVQCFGTFDIFVDGHTIAFPRTKSKEMLAFLVDRRGASCSTAKIAEALWEDGVYDRARQKLLSAIYTDMLKPLRAVNADNIVRKANNTLSIVPEEFDCDYYMALSGDIVSINSFMGEYMTDYSWAELTTGALSTRFFTV